MDKNWQEFFERIQEKEVLQAKYLIKQYEQLSHEERTDWDTLVDFYRMRGHSIQAITDAYLLFINIMREETLFFMRHGRYRYATFAEVADDVYFNDAYMEQYMMGLALSEYLLNNHLANVRWFEELIAKTAGEHYLEIGPGHGELFYKAVRCNAFGEFLAVDIAERSVQLTQEYVAYRGVPDTVNYHVCCQDFFDFSETQKFDAIVMGEVLEHVERPLEFLQKIAEIAAQNAFIFITVPLNTPARDHIYLFRRPEELFTLVERAGLTCVEERLTTYNDTPLETALSKNQPVMVGLHITKR